MLLGNELLAARVWRHREATEREAAGLFRGLAAGLAAVRAGSTLVAMAESAARDEERHAQRCADLARRLAPEVPAVAPRPSLRLGPPDLDRSRRVLFASVAICCVTETLSAALLLEMREHAADPLARETVHEILRDEIRHARLGWAHLALEAARGDVAWLSARLPGMIRGALPDEADPPLDMAGFGILPRAHVRRVLREVAVGVLCPGLEQLGVDAGPARAEVERLAY